MAGKSWKKGGKRQQQQGQENGEGRRARVADFFKGVTVRDGIVTWGAAHQRLVTPDPARAVGPSSSDVLTADLLKGVAEAMAMVSLNMRCRPLAEI